MKALTVNRTSRIVSLVLRNATVAFTVIFMVKCANPVSPTGGPKDETPPVFLGAEPPLYTKNFKSSRVRIYFDEFVQLKDLSQQVIISPPMNEKPEIKLKGRSVVITFKEELKDSTTYNIFFGNAIVDLTESNPITNFQYVFSTGDVLDSLSFKGNVRDAFNLEPVKDLNVMLYLDNNDTLPFDSLPYFVKPYYYSKTTESGDFAFSNLRDEDYKIFVLEDANTNMRFDQVTERIAFLDSVIHPYFIPPPALPDTLVVEDSLVILPDTLTRGIEPEPVQMYLFMEKDSVQRFIKASLVKTGKIMFVFKEATVAPEIRALNMSDSTDWMLVELNKGRDTVNLWMKEKVPDTLVFEVSDNQEIFDTVSISTIVKARGRRDRDKQKEGDEDKLLVKFGKKTELNTPQRVVFNYPIREFDLTGCMLIENEDTLSPEFRLADSIGLIGEFTHEWLESSNYSFLIPDSTFIGLGGQSHDTLRHRFNSKALADYGNLIMNISVPGTGENYILELFKGDQVVAREIIQDEGEVRFPFLLPGDYRLKVIHDRNGNEQWDAGHYIQGIQPEKVDFFPKTITIRANWDIVEEWAM